MRKAFTMVLIIFMLNGNSIWAMDFAGFPNLISFLFNREDLGENDTTNHKSEKQKHTTKANNVENNVDSKNDAALFGFLLYVTYYFYSLPDTN